MRYPFLTFQASRTTLTYHEYLSPCGSTAFAMKPPYTFIGFSCRKSILRILPGYPKNIPVVDFDRILL